MITIRNAKIVTDDVLFKVFMEAFSDYMITFDFDQKTFMTHMFGKEGNKREYSFVAYRSYKPVGIVIGGINPTMSIKTLRCGGMGVIKEERGSKVATMLIAEHIKMAKSLGCSRVYLEVIKGNGRAMSFYKKMGYSNVYHLSNKTLDFNTADGEIFEKKLLAEKVNLPEGFLVEHIDYSDIINLRSKDQTYLPWQVSFDYFKNLDFHYYGVKYSGNIVGAIVAGGNRLQYIYVLPEFRHMKIAKALLKKTIKDLKPDTLRVTFANNELMEFFTSKYGFISDGLSQYELYQNLTDDK